MRRYEIKVYNHFDILSKDRCKTLHQCLKKAFYILHNLRISEIFGNYKIEESQHPLTKEICHKTLIIESKAPYLIIKIKKKETGNLDIYEIEEAIKRIKKEYERNNNRFGN